MTRLELALAGDIRPHPWPALLAVATDLDSASAAVSAGADIIDLGDTPTVDVTAFVAMHPGVPFCAQDDRAALIRHAAQQGHLVGTAATGPVLLCGDLATARRSKLPRDRLVVQTTLAGLQAVIRAGYSALVQVDPGEAGNGAESADTETASAGGDVAGAADPAASVAAAALSCWLGAAIVRTRHARAVRRALDMTASIQGRRPPSRTVRGLA